MSFEGEGYNPDETIVLQDVAHERVKAFDNEVGQEMERMAVGEFTGALEETRNLLSQAEANFDREPSVEDQEGYSEFIDRARNYSTHFKPEKQQYYRDWVDLNVDHEFFKGAFQRAQENKRIAESAEKIVQAERQGDLARSLRIQRVGSKIVARVENINKLAQGFDARLFEDITRDEVLMKFMEDAFDQQFYPQQKHAPTVIDKIFGRTDIKKYNRELKNKTIREIVQGNLEDSFMEVPHRRLCVKNGNRISDHLYKYSLGGSDGRQQRQDALSYLNTRLRAESEGYVDAALEEGEAAKVWHVGLEDYAKEIGVDATAVADLINGFNQVLGRRLFVDRVFFSTEDSNYLGDFGDGGKMTIYKPRGAKAEFVGTIMHEMGHAIRPDQSLPIDEAIKFGIGLAKTVENDGYSTEYSSNAQEHRRRQLDDSKDTLQAKFRTPESMAKFIENGPWAEEFAEMVAGATTDPMFKTKYPEKYKLVERIFTRVGMDLSKAGTHIFEQIQKMEPDKNEDLLLMIAASKAIDKLVALQSQGGRVNSRNARTLVDQINI